MARGLTVYAWQGWRAGAHPGSPWNNGTHEVIAAPSIAAILRTTGKSRSDLFNVGDTGNAEDIAVAMAEPGVVFWRGLDDRDGEWKRDPPA